MSSCSISAIVPTWNEAAWLPSLLTRLESLSAVSEIIVADNDSEDGTAELARARGCVVVAGGRPGAGRNAGAQVASGEVLLFLDADVGVAGGNLARVEELFADPSCNLAYFRLKPRTRRRSFRFPYLFLDLNARVASRFNRPGLSAPMIAVRADAFRAVGGFDESITAAEDSELIGRVARLRGGVHYVRNPALEVSARRLHVEGPAYAAKSMLWGILRVAGSKASVFEYRWERYPDSVAAQDPMID